jgi:hypothetical protein
MDAGFVLVFIAAVGSFGEVLPTPGNNSQNTYFKDIKLVNHAYRFPILSQGRLSSWVIGAELPQWRPRNRVGAGA